MDHPILSHADPRHIAISRSTGIRIDWRDGHSSDYPLAWLRDHCPCAGCKKEVQQTPFQMYKPVLRIESVEPVGNYALRIHWNDGHNSGIYAYDYLRKICPCEGCTGRIYPTPTEAGS
jgi:DUF971 family protein